MYKRVKQFNREVLGIDDRPIGMLSYEEAEISYISLHEEADEFIEAYQESDVVGVVDAACDSIYFALGILHKLGVSESQLERIFAVIHNANMTKSIGTNDKRDTGAADAVKPVGWVSPETMIAEILNESEIEH